MLCKANRLSVILLVQIGYSALPGIAFLLIMTPLQARFMKTLFMFRKKAATWTDKRYAYCGV